MNPEIEVSVQKQAQALFVRMLVKTALRSIIWCVLAAIVVYFSPESTWVWYVVFAFIAIGLAVALLSKGAAMYANRQEANRDTSPPDSPRK